MMNFLYNRYLIHLASGPRLTKGVDNDGHYFPITEEQFAWVASTVTLGCAISCLPIGYLQNRFGRKWTMIGLVAPFLVGWGLVIWASSFPMLMIGRLFLGIAGGAFCMLAPQYAGEIAEKEIRGVIGTFMQLSLNEGILLTYIVGAFTSVFYLSIICGTIPIIFAIVFFFMPESPVFLVSKKQIPEAIEAYKWLRGEAYNPQQEIDELSKELEESKAQSGSFREELAKTSTRRAMAISFGVMFFQQMCGINIVVFSVGFIFEASSNLSHYLLFINRLTNNAILQAAKTGLDDRFQTIIVGMVLLFSTLIGSSLVDRLGRKILMLLSSIIMCLMLLALGVFFWLQDNQPETAEQFSWLPITSLCLFLIGYSVGYGPLTWYVNIEYPHL